MNEPRLGRREDLSVVVAGPTASGKSDVALSLAEAIGGGIINADSIQVYRELRILSARPGPEDEARAPHFLYGVMGADETCSAARWRAMALDAIAECRDRGLVPILAGGTGLYLTALLEGLAPVPDIPGAVRARARALFDAVGPAAFHDRLAERDPESAAVVPPADRLRVTRAYEVVEATGRPLPDWQKRPHMPPLDGTVVRGILVPPRGRLAARIDARLETMVAMGAIEEVAALLDRGTDPDHPMMKALGTPHFVRHLKGELSLEQALVHAQAATRRYAKRQRTWFANQKISRNAIFEQESHDLLTRILSKIAHEA